MRAEMNEWMQIYDESAPRHASALSYGFRCGIISNRLHSTRRDAQGEGFSLSWIISGSGQLHVNGTSYALHPGHVILRRPGETGWLELDAHVTHRRCYIRLDKALYDMLCILLPELATLPPVIPQAYDAQLYARFQALVEAVETACERSALPFLPQLRDVLCGMLTLRDGTEDTRILEAATLLTSLSPTTPLPEIAAQCGIPYGQFRKRFAQVYGLAPGQWRIRQRVLRAQQALACGEAIQKVAEMLDYADVYTFTHQFCDVTGITPKAYRLNNID